MQRARIIVQGYGITTCLSQREAIKRIKALNASTWVEQAYQRNGYIGFNIETGVIK